MSDVQDGADMLAEHDANHGHSLLDALGALREQRANETTTDLPLPGFDGRLWATFRLPAAEKATHLMAMMGAGQKSVLSDAMDLIARTTVGLYLADPGAEAPIVDDEGELSPAFRHLPGGSDELPVNFSDHRLEAIPQLCPSRPGAKDHTPETRVRSLFGRDSLVIVAASMVAGWAVGGGDAAGALSDLSDRFVGE